MKSVTFYLAIAFSIIVCSSCSNDLKRESAQEQISACLKANCNELGQCTFRIRKTWNTDYKFGGSFGCWREGTNPPFGEELKMLNYFFSKNLLKLQNQTSYNECGDSWVTHTITMTDEGTKYVVSEDNANFKVLSATFDIDEITGIIQEKDAVKATVEYKIKQVNQTPFGKFWDKNCFDISESHKANFVKYDDGWRLEGYNPSLSKSNSDIAPRNIGYSSDKSSDKQEKDDFVSEGKREGLLTNFSKKGGMFQAKTYEGELEISRTSNATMTWSFSVTEEQIAEELLKSIGKRVSLHYKEAAEVNKDKGQTKYFVDRVTNTPTVDVSVVNDPISVGKLIYTEKCAQCHGSDGKLNLNGSKDLSLTQISAEDQKLLIRNGIKSMPAYKNLTDAQLDATVMYLAMLKY